MRHSCLLLASHLPSGHQHGHEEMAERETLRRIIPTLLQLPRQLCLSSKVPPHVLKGLEMVFLALMKINCCAVVSWEGCLRCLCLSGMSLVCG